MKKFVLFLACTLVIGYGNAVFAHPHHGCHHRYHYHGYYSGSNVYVIRTDFNQTQSNFHNCNNRQLLTETTTHYLSNGGRRTYVNHTILNPDGTVFIANCSSVHHFIFNNKHYFIIKQGKYSKLLTEDGQQLNKRNYTYLKEIAPNRFLARYEKRYGIIDLEENLITPLKYNKFEQITDKLFISKLNGFYGLVDCYGNILFDNSYDKIKPLYDTFLLEKYNKYGLADMNGNLIAEVKYDKIKKLKEYILLKADKCYKVLDANGNFISDKSYKKIKIERNRLLGKTNDKYWEEIKNNEV